MYGSVSYGQATYGGSGIGAEAVVIEVIGIASTVAFGTPIIALEGFIMPQGIASTVAFGTPTITTAPLAAGVCMTVSDAPKLAFTVSDHGC